MSRCPYCHREYTLKEKIIEFLKKKDNNFSISQIHKSFREYDYKAVHKHIKNLEKGKIIKLKQEKKKQGKPIFVKLIKSKRRKK